MAVKGIVKPMTEYYDPKTYPKEWNYLQSGTIIDDYIIERELAHGGFSSVYLARQLSDQAQVAIKEYLPRALAHRTWNNAVVPNNEESRNLFLKGRALFFEEAKVLANLKHHNIVEVLNFFQANETVYMVMTYDYGITLDKLVKNKNINIKITEQFLLSVFSKLLTGLNAVHKQNLIHLDIKPGNILIRPDNDPLLLDFGAIQKTPQSKKSIQATILTKGFSPVEQFSNLGNMGPWSDIYAVGASMRYCLDGKVPVTAPDRAIKDGMISAMNHYKRRYSKTLLKAIDWAMKIEPSQRPQTVDELQKALR